MTNAEAITTERMRYVRACENAQTCRKLFMPQLEAQWRRAAHRHLMTLQRLTGNTYGPWMHACERAS
jgi:hypothetical protein